MTKIALALGATGGALAAAETVPFHEIVWLAAALAAFVAICLVESPTVR